MRYLPNFSELRFLLLAVALTTATVGRSDDVAETAGDAADGGPQDLSGLDIEPAKPEDDNLSVEFTATGQADGDDDSLDLEQSHPNEPIEDYSDLVSDSEEEGVLSLEMQANLNRYANNVKRLEAEFGAYDSDLSQELLGLGMVYQQVGDHTQAIDSFRRAIHVNRINEGLYSLSEIPILERLIESHAALGEWEEVNNRYQFMFRLHNRNFGGNDLRVLPALEKLSAWHLQAYAEDFSGSPLNHLLTARNLFDSTARIIAINFGAQDKRIAEPLRKRTMVDYYLATHTPQGTTQADMTTIAANYPGVSDEAGLASYMINSYSLGKRALSQIREIYLLDETATLQERTAAIVELGDWHMLFNRRQTAFSTYEEAVALLQSSEGGAGVMQEFFGRPVALPATQIFDGPELKTAPQEQGRDGFILLTFNVDDNGRARDVEVMEAEPEDHDAIAGRLRKRLRATRFRPRFEAGAPVDTADLTYRYRFKY